MSKHFWTATLIILLFFPSSYGFYKGIFAAFVAIGIALKLPGRNPFYLNKSIGAGTLLAICLGLLLIFYDLVLFHDVGSIKEASFWVGAPCVYLLIVVLFSRDSNCMSILDRAIYGGSLFVSLNSISYVAFSVLRIPYPLKFLDLDYIFGLDDRGFLAFTTNNLPILAFTIPFMMANVMVTGKSTKWRVGITILSIVAALASLRIAILLNTAIAVIAIIAFSPSRRFRIWAISAALSLAGILVVGAVLLSDVISSNPIIQGIYSIKFAKKLSGEDLRYQQAIVWFESAAERPLFGHGLSSTEISLYNLAGEVREHHSGPVHNPYGYELTYLKTLSEIGFIPLGLYASFCLWIMARLILMGYKGKTYDERNALSYAFGMALFLVASGTNGYLMTFGYVWTIFFPVIYLNRMLLQKTTIPQ